MPQTLATALLRRRKALREPNLSRDPEVGFRPALLGGLGYYERRARTRRPMPLAPLAGDGAIR
jgi:hypothetical protein